MTPDNTEPSPTKRAPRGETRARLIAAARDLVRRKGFADTSVDDLCAAASVTKGAFFHHFASKDALGVALIEDWTETTGAMFAAHPYNAAPDPFDRLLAYINLRRALLCMPLPEFTCVAGTTVQEVYATSDPMRRAARNSLVSGANHVRAHIAALLAAHPVPGVTADSLARQFQIAVQGGIILAKAEGNASPAAEALDHLERYLRLLFGR